MAGRRIWVQGLTPDRKAEATAAYARLVAGMKARWLPATRPDGSPVPVDILGRWRGEACAFAVRFRDDAPTSVAKHFDIPFARMQHFDGRYGVDWMRHTGRWWRLRDGMTLVEAIGYIADEPALRPPI